ncbi:MAG TPA: type II toxin-antitoxin system VapC family toxin [Phycisphaerae bacterium]|jgi:tRNA(fMet)-specific endonuclease VapC|nr:type II toxin-antitoxin system VapC family toxin [Phycisphaerae bacterium]
MIVLDSDAISFLERQRSDSIASRQLRNRLAKLSAEHQIVTTVITYEEQTRGWMKEFTKSLTPSALINAYADLLAHLNIYKEMIVIPYTTEAEAKFEELRKQRIRIGTRDIRIAAITLTNEAILVTRNVQDFRLVPQLQIEDWTKP